MVRFVFDEREELAPTGGRFTGESPVGSGHELARSQPFWRSKGAASKTPQRLPVDMQLTDGVVVVASAADRTLTKSEPFATTGR